MNSPYDRSAAARRRRRNRFGHFDNEATRSTGISPAERSSLRDQSISIAQQNRANATPSLIKGMLNDRGVSPVVAPALFGHVQHKLEQRGISPDDLESIAAFDSQTLQEVMDEAVTEAGILGTSEMTLERLERKSKIASDLAKNRKFGPVCADAGLRAIELLEQDRSSDRVLLPDGRVMPADQAVRLLGITQHLQN